MKKENKNKICSFLAIGLAAILAWPNVNWSIFADASDTAEENVYFFFDDRVVKDTTDVEYSMVEVTDEMKTETNAKWDGDVAWEKGELSDWDNTEISVEGGTPDWEQQSGSYNFVRYDGTKYQMWRQHIKGASNSTDGFDWTQYLITSQNYSNYELGDLSTPQGTPYGGDSIICYYESEDGITWKRVCQNEYYYLDPDTNEVVKTNIVFIGGHGPSVTENENTNTDEPHFLLACQAEDGGSDEWNAAGNNGGGMGGGVAVSWSEDGIHWEVPITVSTYDNGDMFMQADTQNNVHWSTELESYVVLTRMTKLAGDYAGGRGVLQLKSEDKLTSITQLATIKSEAVAAGKDYREVMNDYWTTPQVALQGETLNCQPYYAMVDDYEEGYYIGVAPMLDDIRTSDTYGKVYNTLVWSPDLENWYYMDDGKPFINTSTEYSVAIGSELYTIYATEPVDAGNGVRIYYSANPYMHSYSVSELETYDPELWEAFIGHYGEELTTLSKTTGGTLQSKAMKFVSLDYDAFAGYSVAEGAISGTVTTTGFKVTGDTLRIAASSTENISVAVLDEDGNVVEGYENGTLDTTNKDARGRYAVTWGNNVSTQDLNDGNTYYFQISVSGDTMVYSIAGYIEAQELNKLSAKADTIAFYELGIAKESGITIVPAQNLGTVSYTSGDTKVATVDAEGYITSVGTGTTTVTATLSDGRTQSVNVTVSDVASEHSRDGLWELRENTLSVKHWTESIESAWGHGSITLYNSLMNALREGAVLEIAYKASSSGGDNLWLEGNDKDGNWAVFGNVSHNVGVAFSEDEMRRVHYDDGISIMQVTYEAIDSHFYNGWEANRSTIGFGANSVTEILYVKVGTKVDYEDRTNLYDLEDIVNVENPGTSSFTLTQEMCEVLIWGGAIEISYESDKALAFTNSNGTTIDGTLLNGESNIAQITYESLVAVLGLDGITIGTKIYYTLSEDATIYSAKVGTRTTYKENLLDVRDNGYEVALSTQLSQSGKWAWLSFSSEMLTNWKEGAILEIGFTPAKTSFADGCGNNLFISQEVNEAYQKNCTNASCTTCSTGTGSEKHSEIHLGAMDRYSNGLGLYSIIGNGLYYNSEGNVLQLTYEAAVEYLQNPKAITLSSNVSYTINYIRIEMVGNEIDLASEDLTLDSVIANGTTVSVNVNVPEGTALPYTVEEVLLGEAPVILDGTKYTASWYATGTESLAIRVTTDSEAVATKVAKEIFEVIIPGGFAITSETDSTYVITLDEGARWQNTDRIGTWNRKEYNSAAAYYYIDSARATLGAFAGNNFWISVQNAFQGADTSWIPSAQAGDGLMSSIAGSAVLVDGEATDESKQWNKINRTDIWSENGTLMYRFYYWATGSDYWTNVQTVKILSGTESTTTDKTRVVVFKGDFDVARNAAGKPVPAERLDDIRYNASFYGSAYTQTVIDADSISVNGTVVDSINITKAGDNEVVINTYLGNTIQDIVYYYVGDANADNEINVADIIAMKKLAIGTTTASSSAQSLGANTALTTSSIDDEDVIVLRKTLVGAQDRTNLSELTDTVEATQMTDITSTWGTGGFVITEDMAEKLASGAIIEIGYNYENIANDWIGEKTLWVVGQGASQYYQIGYTGSSESAVAGDELRWNSSGNIAQVSVDTLNNYLAEGWNTAGNTVSLQASSPCKIQYVKVGTVITEDEATETTEDRSNLYTLTNSMAVSTSNYDAEATAAYDNSGIYLSEEQQALLKEGAVLEIEYACTVASGNVWMENQTFWFAGDDSAGKWIMIGVPLENNSGVVAARELKWNDSGTIVQITYEQLTEYLGNGGKGWFAWQAAGPCTIISMKIGQRVE